MMALEILFETVSKSGKSVVVPSAIQKAPCHKPLTSQKMNYRKLSIFFRRSFKDGLENIDLILIYQILF
jgi:hypothetical protein